MMSSILQKWCPSWDLPRGLFWNAVTDAVVTGTLKVSKTCTGDTRIDVSTGMNSLTIKGNWIASTPIPHQTLETREKCLEGKDKELLLGLSCKILRWLPEDRPSAEELFEDEFLIQWENVEKSDPT